MAEIKLVEDSTVTQKALNKFFKAFFFQVVHCFFLGHDKQDSFGPTLRDPSSSLGVKCHLAC